MPGPHGSPLKSANGFRNILPMTRSERRSQRDKVALCVAASRKRI